MRNTILSNKTLGLALCSGALALASVTSAYAQHLGGGLVGGATGQLHATMGQTMGQLNGRIGGSALPSGCSP